MKAAGKKTKAGARIIMLLAAAVMLLMPYAAMAGNPLAEIYDEIISNANGIAENSEKIDELKKILIAYIGQTQRFDQRRL